MAPETLIALTESNSLADLQLYLERLEHAGNAETRLIARDRVLAVVGCTSAPAGLFDQTPLVLGMRVFEIEPTRAIVDETVMIRGVLDRIARMRSAEQLRLQVPTERATAAWAGVMPPQSGWQPAGIITAASLRDVAHDGVQRIQSALPNTPGEAVVKKIRSEVWNTEIAEGIPAAVAFAAEALGFLHEEEVARVSTTRSWTRVSTSRGEVLLRRGASGIL